jgi:hypothetical protein
MTYSTFKLEAGRGGPQFAVLTEAGWEPCAVVSPLSGFQQFIHGHPNFIQDVCDYYSSHWDGVIYQHDAGETATFRT